MKHLPLAEVSFTGVIFNGARGVALAPEFVVGGLQLISQAHIEREKLI